MGTYLLERKCHVSTPTNIHATNLGIYKMRSAITNPTVKNMLDAGKNGTTRNRSPIARLSCDVVS